MGVFHHRVARWLTRKLPNWRQDGVWDYNLILEALQEAGLEEIKVYIGRWNNTMAQFIGTRPIMDLYLEVERRPVDRVAKWWWDRK